MNITVKCVKAEVDDLLMFVCLVTINTDKWRVGTLRVNISAKMRLERAILFMGNSCLCCLCVFPCLLKVTAGPFFSGQVPPDLISMLAQYVFEVNVAIGCGKCAKRRIIPLKLPYCAPSQDITQYIRNTLVLN